MASRRALRNNMDAEYKHVVLRLIFLEYIADAFGARLSQLESRPAQLSGELRVKDSERFVLPRPDHGDE